MSLKRRALKLLRKLNNIPEDETAALARRISGDPRALKALAYLEAKELVSVTRAWGGELVDLELLPDGLTYFEDQADRRRERWTDRAVGFVAGVASTVLAHFIIQAIQASIG